MVHRVEVHIMEDMMMDTMVPQEVGTTIYRHHLEGHQVPLQLPLRGSTHMIADLLLHHQDQDLLLMPHDQTTHILLLTTILAGGQNIQITTRAQTMVPVDTRQAEEFRLRQMHLADLHQNTMLID